MADKRLSSGAPRQGYLGPQETPTGQTATVLLETVTDPRLNRSQPTNIPLLVPGQVNIDQLLAGEEPNDEQYEIAVRHALSRVMGGERLQAYPSIDAAVQAAKEESEERGAGAETPTSFQYRIKIGDQEHLLTSDHELTLEETRKLARKLSPPAGTNWGKIGAATAIGMAGPAAGAAVGALTGPLAPVMAPLLATAGSYGARRANVALGLEEPGTMGDLLSVAGPVAGYAVGPALRVGSALGRGGIPGMIGRGLAAGGVTNYATGDPALGAAAGGAATYIPLLIRMAAKSTPGRALIAGLKKTGDIMRPEGIAALLGFLRTQGQLTLEDDDGQP